MYDSGRKNVNLFYIKKLPKVILIVQTSCKFALIRYNQLQQHLILATNYHTECKSARCVACKFEA